MQRTSTAGRIEALDFLRGFFILIIISDHLWRWPSLLQFASGRGELWASAAEGFVIISGLLIGYVRGRKGLKKPFLEISKKVVTRGLMLYVWAFIATIILVALTWTISFHSGVAFIPYDRFDWWGLVKGTLTLHYTHELIYFLYLYAIFLVLSPILIWLLRKGLWWVGVIASLGIWWVGYTYPVEWMQWQIVFFLPAIAGFYLDQIITFCRRIPRSITWLLTAVVVASIVWSAFVVLPHDPGTYRDAIFTREPLSLARVGLAFTWFVALAYLFNLGLPWIEKYFGWLLLPIGTRSLTAYIVHVAPLMAISFLLPETTALWLNTLIAIIAILITWAIVKLPGINRVIPR